MGSDNRPFVPPKIVVCVGGVVVSEGKALFIRQAGGSLRGFWSIPWGFVEGRSASGVAEPPHEAVIREVWEEAGVHAAVDGLLGVQNDVRSDGEAAVYLLFLCHPTGGLPTPDGVETDRAAYLSLADMSSLGEPIDALCVWLVTRVLQGRYTLLPSAPDSPYVPRVAFI